MPFLLIEDRPAPGRFRMAPLYLMGPLYLIGPWLAACALLGANPALAQDAPPAAPAPAAPAPASLPTGAGADQAAAGSAEGSALTFRGVTFYGTWDLGFAYQTHGAGLDAYSSKGLQYLISKSSNNAVASFAGNGLSQSKLGLRGVEGIYDDWSLVFRLETGFQPTSGQIIDGPRSVAQTNGKALTAQSSSSDSSLAGQVFNRAAFAGLRNPVWGTLTYGRQNSVLADQVIAYDPQQGSYAFSVLGYSGAYAGGGSTEDRRLNNALKYVNKIHTDGLGTVSVGGLYQFGQGDGGDRGDALQVSLGWDRDGLSVDGAFARKWDVISAGGLSAAQVAQATQLGYDIGRSLSATVADTTAYTLMGAYTWGAARFFAGYQYMTYTNPSDPPRPGGADIGGYTLAFLNTTAYNHAKVQQTEWTGLRYALTPDLTWAGAYYHTAQNSYGATDCADSRASTCAGQLDAVSATLDYRFNLHFDAYVGAMYSHVSNGMAAGYLHSGTLSPMVGGRLNF